MASKADDKKRQSKKKQSPLQAAFLAAYSGCGRISRAAAVAKICRDDHYRWLKEDSHYLALFEEARKKAIGFLEDVAVKRATRGWLEPVFYQGQATGVVRKFSDNLLMFTLKGNCPEKYRERSDIHHSGELTLQVTLNTNGQGKCPK